MKNQAKQLFYIIVLITTNLSLSQELANDKLEFAESDLFEVEEILPIKLSYSLKEIKTKTNDSTYINSELTYQRSDGSWNSLEVKLRARGHNRKEICYFTPIKVRIKKSVRKGTIFENHKKFKLVLPCLIQKDMNDKLLKEYLAYRLYEQVGKYHFRTRLLDIEFHEVKNKKTKEFRLKGFFIEDIDNLAKRVGGNEIKNRKVHPYEQDAYSSTQNDIFQYMIGNTDYSSAYTHNAKLIFIKGKKAIPVPFDFDLCGLVNASYAVVSKIGDQTLPITSVTERLYRGYRRSEVVYDQVRSEYLANKNEIFAEIDKLRPWFDDVLEYESAKEYILGFYKILQDESKFRKEIVYKGRIK